METFLKPTKRDILIDLDLNGAIIYPQKNFSSSNVIVLVSDPSEDLSQLLLNQSGIKSLNNLVSKSKQTDASPTASTSTATNFIYSPSHKLLSNKIFITLMAVGTYKIQILNKNMKSIKMFLLQISEALSSIKGINKFFIKPLIRICSIEGRPIRTVVELMNSKYCIASNRLLTRVELIILGKIFHRIPFLLPDEYTGSLVNKSIILSELSLVGRPSNYKKNAANITLNEIDQGINNYNLTGKKESQFSTLQASRKSKTRTNNSECNEISKISDSFNNSLETHSKKQHGDSNSTSDDKESKFIVNMPKFINYNWSNDYDVHEEIGKGNFAIVYKITSKTSKQVFALKAIDMEIYNLRKDYVEREISAIDSLCPLNELKQRVAHQNVMIFYDVYFVENLGIGIISEFANGGDLFNYIANKTTKKSSKTAKVKCPCLSEHKASNIMKQLICALGYLQDNFILHRDIKPENILLTRTNEGQKMPLIKLADFGLAVQINRNYNGDIEKVITGICGTPYYIAPEMLLQTGYGMQVDVWATGVVMFIILAGYPPFYSDSEDHNEIFEKIIDCEVDFECQTTQHISLSAKALINSFLCFEPSLRISTEEALEHVWFKKYLDKI